MTNRYFATQTFSFLSSLGQNSTREWFEANRQDYEDFVHARAGVLRFMAREIPVISQHLCAVPKKVGGSLALQF